MDSEILVQQIERAKMLLSNRDIELVVQGCGCCGSPGVYLAVEGEPIIFDPGETSTELWRRTADNARIDTTE